jgi:hypothetical protein
MFECYRTGQGCDVCGAIFCALCCAKQALAYLQVARLCGSPAKENTRSLPRKLMSESVIVLLLEPLLPLPLPLLLLRSARQVTA